jgi:hypothetical protein
MMSELDLSKLDQADAVLLQNGLMAMGFYSGTTLGKPGPATLEAYSRYRSNAVMVTEAPAVKALTKRLIEILKGEEGVRESPANSNRGKRVEEYQAATWLQGSGWAWCAAFICWGIKKLDEESPLPFPRPQTAGAWDFERWAREDAGPTVKLYKPRKSTTPIKAGDIIIFTFSHIGLAIEDEKGGYVRTVEGNTSTSGSREGGGVYVQRRALSLVRSHIRLFA